MKAWIARNVDGEVLMHSRKPHKIKGLGVWGVEDADIFPVYPLPEGINPQWEDDEPIKVEVTLKRI